MANAKNAMLRLGAQGKKMHEPTGQDLLRFEKQIKKLSEASQTTATAKQIKGGTP